MLVTKYPVINSSEHELSNWLISAGIDTTKLVMNTLPDGERRLVAACPISAGEKILTLPESHLMSAAEARQSVIGEKISEAGLNHHSAHSFLAAYILQERQGKDSFWSLYLDALPADFNHVPLFYSADELLLLKSSPVLEMALNRRFTLEQDYNQLKVIEEFNDYSLLDYMWARTAINTRCFSLNGDVVMAPFMDFANHEPQPNARWRAGEDKASLQLVCQENIAPGEEITISYGSKSNRRFYGSYGFVRADDSYNCARITLALNPGDPLLNEKMGLLAIRDTSFDFDIGANEEHGFLQVMKFLRISTASQLLENDRAYDRPMTKTGELVALEAFLSCTRQMLAMYDLPSTQAAEASISAMNRENSEMFLAQEKHTLNSYVLLASTAITLLTHGNSLQYLRQDIETDYQADLLALVQAPA
ncbi:SET domain-containing protein [Thalassomonas viridans]|uniref:SET domain-containing protein n=1 Tax=Thalassomonas viridans TaxID=137584 RepID=A0AAE9YXL1_9GAMM|nr:SET domain-containing protein [Thalassomonas viridans]WDE02778.1 SET domain-containing protein [Thalassomonas viridans]